ncbi:ketose-bisphosphate aldolase [Candidatus Latescibacterota bacterium]
MLVNLNEILIPARNGKYCIGAFNIYNLETAGALFHAAVEQDMPVIFAFGERYIHVANLDVIAAIVKEFAGSTTLPMVLHLDHCKSVDVIYRAVQAGFTSVMFDGSNLPFEKNLAETKKVVEFAHAVNVTVEAELGSVPFDRTDAIPEEFLTKADEAENFMQETGIDALAVAIGSAHGEYKGKPTIYHDRLKDIARAVPLPLVLHGGSGIPEEDVLAAIGGGIAKINVNTEISKAAVKKLQDLLARPKPGHLSDLGMEIEKTMTEEIGNFIRLFACGKIPNADTVTSGKGIS